MMVPKRWHGSRLRGDSAYYSRPTQANCLSLKTRLFLIPKEANMQYKTIILELLQQRPRIYNQLRKSRKLLLMVDRYARELKASHQACKDYLSQARPGSSTSQIASEALEIALKEMEDRLPNESPPNETEPVSLEAAMVSIRLHMPPA